MLDNLKNEIWSTSEFRNNYIQFPLKFDIA